MSEGVQLGPFELGEQVGRGGMGVVHRARHGETGQVVAIKVLLAEAAREADKRRDFRRQVQALAKLHHPSVAGIVDYGEIDAMAVERGSHRLARDVGEFARDFWDELGHEKAVKRVGEMLHGGDR